MSMHPTRRLLFALSFAAVGSLPAAAADPSYVAIPGGSLQSVLSGGSDNAPVSIAPFAMRGTPVSNAEFGIFVAAHPQWRRGQTPAIFADASYLNRWASPAQAGGAQESAQPVTSVSWFAAQAYCESEGARLPTWHEWEYVAAADEQQPDARANPQWRARILSWYGRSSSVAPAAVGGPANFYGVRDVHGLIWEWVDDFNALLVSADSRNQGDPDQLQYCGAGAISLKDRDNFAILMRIALLSALEGAATTNDLGFRCVRDSDKEIK